MAMSLLIRLGMSFGLLGLLGLLHGCAAPKPAPVEMPARYAGIEDLDYLRTRVLADSANGRFRHIYEALLELQQQAELTHREAWAWAALRHVQIVRVFSLPGGVDFLTRASNLSQRSEIAAQGQIERAERALFQGAFEELQALLEKPDSCASEAVYRALVLDAEDPSLAPRVQCLGLLLEAERETARQPGDPVRASALAQRFAALLPRLAEVQLTRQVLLCGAAQALLYEQAGQPEEAWSSWTDLARSSAMQTAPQGFCIFVASKLLEQHDQLQFMAEAGNPGQSAAELHERTRQRWQARSRQTYGLVQRLDPFLAEGLGATPSPAIAALPKERVQAGVREVEQGLDALGQIFARSAGSPAEPPADLWSAGVQLAAEVNTVTELLLNLRSLLAGRRN
jgi:hypothetical protein